MLNLNLYEPVFLGQHDPNSAGVYTFEVQKQPQNDETSWMYEVHFV